MSMHPRLYLGSNTYGLQARKYSALWPRLGNSQMACTVRALSPSTSHLRESAGMQLAASQATSMDPEAAVHDPGIPTKGMLKGMQPYSYVTRVYSEKK